MEIISYEFAGEGMHRVFENEKWTVGIKNWKPANDINGIDMLERHNLTDELFVLVSGSCTLIYAEPDGNGLKFSTLIIMETFISKMRRLKGVRKMILIEDSNTSMDNSDIYQLSAAQLAEIRALVD